MEEVVPSKPYQCHLHEQCLPHALHNAGISRHGGCPSSCVPCIAAPQKMHLFFQRMHETSAVCLSYLCFLLCSSGPCSSDHIHYLQGPPTTTSPVMTQTGIDASCLTWEGQQCQGKTAIVEKLSSLPFQKIQHSITSQDHQPTPDSCILSMVVGQLKADEDPIIGFHQIFILKNINDAWVCTNDMFRLALHNYG
ncbi:nuclear transport factor 2 isoform X1 [Chelonia mydas]|uniref:nuclear transport factor 2 isoform X1 n=1 Tax=Chelonia mydas TaxID=8469 RepID=UPI001CA821D3|nr:nuclear transport factor 2 isoform X1 [Chelonia mydas]